MAQEQINLHINDGEPFFAHEATINFTPTQIALDFKCITPRTDPRSKRPSFQLKHNVVMLDAWHAKTMVGVLANVVEKYEKEFGKIAKPKGIVKAEKEQKEAKKKAGKKPAPEVPTYMG